MSTLRSHQYFKAPIDTTTFDRPTLTKKEWRTHNKVLVKVAV